MKKLLFALFLLPSVAFGQAAVYQPATPTPLLSTTPGAKPGMGYAANKYLMPLTEVYQVDGLVVVATPAAALPTPAPTEITPVPQVVMQPTALPTLFPVTPNALVNSAALKAIRINNQFNVDIDCTFGAAAATPVPFRVPAGTEDYENLQQQGLKMSTGISCIHPGAATPAAGTLEVWGY